MKLANVFATLVGVLIAAIGLTGAAVPSVLLEFGQSLQTLGALYVGAVIRIIFGATLVWVASGSRMPKTLRVLGAVSITAGLLAPLVGVERFHAVFNWFSNQGPLFLRCWASVAVIFGLFIVYIVSAPRRERD